MPTTCFVCCEESDYWTLPPCNHTHICWKCCLKLVEGSIFSCPFCKDKPEAKSQLLFVTTQQMETQNFQLLMQLNPFRSNKNSFYFYSNSEVAEYIEAETSHHCVLCGQVHESINLLKKHLERVHRMQFCDVCLQNRKCMTAEQRLYYDQQLQMHLKEGEASNTGEISLYHPNCQFCSRRFYDLQAFKIHLKMSAHLKCEICELNCPKLKYVYYKNFEQLQQHHRKSHFVCEVGECITRKLENVFASEALLQQHKRRLHRKYRGDRQEKLDNIILGFNKNAEEDVIEFDGIGKDLVHQFTVFELQGPVQKENHSDELIDLREFYAEIVKANLRPRMEDVVARVQEMNQREDLRNKEPNFAQLPLYRPLEMAPLPKFQCERLLKKVYPQREAEAIADLFFAKKNEFRSPQEFIQAIQKKMRAYSTYAFFVVFPQLIRNLKGQNKTKAMMDEHYGACLRRLPVNRLFVFHEFDRYSALIEITKSTVEEEVAWRLEAGEVDLQVYARFLREMSSNYYVERHEQIYWVSREKITHLYHMVERCKTKDFLKMNWLLKVGLSNPSYVLLSKFYYSTRKDIEAAKRTLQPLSLQELALLNAYLSICLQALLDSQSFQLSKKNPKPHYLTSLLQEMPAFKKLSPKQLEELRVLEGHSHALVKRNNERRLKGVVIDENDCPSLLAPVQVRDVAKKPKNQRPEIMLGKGTLPTPWNEERALLKKKPPLEKAKNQEEFPTLGREDTNTSLNSPAKQKALKANYQKEKEEDFPVFNFNQKFVTHKLPTKAEKEPAINSWVNFNNKQVSRSYWDEDCTRKKWVKIKQQNESEKIERREINAQANTAKKKKKETPMALQGQGEEDRYLRMAIQESLHTAQQEKHRREKAAVKKEPEVIIIPKKKLEEEEPKKPNKNKKAKEQPEKQPNASSQSAKQQLSLFQRIELQEKSAKKKSPFRRDISNDRTAKPQLQDPISSILPSKQPKYLSSLPVGLNFDDDDFVPLGQAKSGNQESIVTRIIKESQSKEETQIDQPKQRHRKKKYRAEDND